MEAMVTGGLALEYLVHLMEYFKRKIKAEAQNKEENMKCDDS